jgi:hypothetical protein
MVRGKFLILKKGVEYGQSRQGLVYWSVFYAGISKLWASLKDIAVKNRITTYK